MGQDGIPLSIGVIIAASIVAAGIVAGLVLLGILGGA